MSFSELNVSVSLDKPGETPPKVKWLDRLLLCIPEPWLDTWASRINLATLAFVAVWALGTFALGIVGVFRHWGLTVAQGVLIQCGWVPVMMLNMMLLTARTVHIHSWLDYQKSLMRALDEGMARVVADAVSEGVQRAQSGEPAPERKGPTLQ